MYVQQLVNNTLPSKPLPSKQKTFINPYLQIKMTFALKEFLRAKVSFPGGALKILCTQNDLNANGIKIAGDSRYTQN